MTCLDMIPKVLKVITSDNISPDKFRGITKLHTLDTEVDKDGFAIYRPQIYLILDDKIYRIVFDSTHLSSVDALNEGQFILDVCDDFGLLLMAVNKLNS